LYNIDTLFQHESHITFLELRGEIIMKYFAVNTR